MKNTPWGIHTSAPLSLEAEREWGEPSYELSIICSLFAGPFGSLRRAWFSGLERPWLATGLSVDLQGGEQVHALGDVGGPHLAFLPETSTPIRGVYGTSSLSDQGHWFSAGD